MKKSNMARVLCAAVFALAGPLMRLFVAPEETEVIRLGARYLRLMGFFYFMPGIIHLTKILGAAMLVYLAVSWTTLIYVGYLLLAILLFFLTEIILKTIKATEDER
jgi:Na+-driven multidrug efflux pump